MINNTFCFEYYNFYNLICIKSEIRQTIYKLLIDEYYIKYEKLNRSLNNKIHLDDIVDKYFNNIHVYYIKEKYTSLHFIIFYDQLSNKFYYIICSINSGIFINNNQLLYNVENIIKNEFLEYLKSGDPRICYDRFKLFYYYNGKEYYFDKIDYTNYKYGQESILCVSEFGKNEFKNIKKKYDKLMQKYNEENKY